MKKESKQLDNKTVAICVLSLLLVIFVVGTFVGQNQVDKLRVLYYCGNDYMTIKPVHNETNSGQMMEVIGFQCCNKHRYTKNFNRETGDWVLIPLDKIGCKFIKTKE